MILPKLPQSAAAVARHYDELDPFYRAVWGEHVHHGYWASGRETPAQAADALVDLLAQRLQLAPGMHLCDIGCGYGASARRLALTQQVTVAGLTLSRAQAEYARTAAAGGAGVSIECGDWLENRFADASFERAYAIESSEHMVDKQAFFDQAYRVLKPGGTLAVYAWLARTDAHRWEIRHLLEPICREGRLPSMGDEHDYRTLARRSGFSVAEVQDLSVQVRRTWSICLRRLLGKLCTERAYLAYLFDRRAGNRVFLLTLLRLLLAYRTGSMRYCLLVLRKDALA
jgi:tocopherol O-methyltransferase